MQEQIRVLQVVTHMNRGGLETMLMNYYRHINRNKVQFDFLTHRTYDGDYGEEIKALGGIIYHLPKLNPISTTYKRALNSFFAAHQEYKIVHVHQDCMSSVILKAARKKNVPIRIAHCHSSSQDKDLKYPIKRVYQHYIPKYATDLMACGQAAGEWMFPNQKFIVLNNAVDVSKFYFNPIVRNIVRSELGIADDELLIGNVGRFSVPKNHSFIIEIFKHLQAKNPKAKLLLVGNDSGPDCAPIANVIKQKIRSLSLEDKVIFTGTQNDVARYLMAMDIFLLPSLYEGFPVTTVEAQATGLECFISDKVPADCMITELVHQFSLNEPADLWASRIVDIYTRSARRDHSQEIIDAGFDISHNAKWLEDYYVGKLENQ